MYEKVNNNGNTSSRICNVFVDTQPGKGKKTGIGVYSYELFNSLKKFSDKKKFAINEFSSKIFSGDLSTPKRFIYDQLERPVILSNKKVDIVHITGFSSPLFYPKKKIILTVHDIIPLIYPIEYRTPISKFYWKHFLYSSIKHSSMLIANSEWTRNDVVKYLKINPEKIRVVYLGVDTLDVSESDSKDVFKKFNIPEKYIIYIGSLEKRKNIDILAKAASKLKIPLVVIGKTLPGYKKIEDKYTIYCDYVTDIEKNALTSKAFCLVMPSFYEGFSFPIVEGQRHFVPVIASDASCHREIGGSDECCIYFNPNSLDELYESIKSLLDNEIKRQNLIKNGHINSLRFTWDNTAKRTIEVYEEVYNNIKIYGR